MFTRTIMLLIASICLFQEAWGHSSYMARIPGGYNVPHPCGRGTWRPVGHGEPDTFNIWNEFGNDFRRMDKMWSRRLCMLDSDGDGLTNGQELGDPQCVWTTGMESGQAIGHPGFCEPGRRSCKRNSSYRQCRNPFDGAASTSHRRPPPGSNKHPQSFETERLGMQQGGMGVLQHQQEMNLPNHGIARQQEQQRFVPQMQNFPMQMPAQQWSNDVPNLDTFQTNLNQMRLQGGQAGPVGFGVQRRQFGSMSPGPNIGNLQQQVQRRMQFERLAPGMSSNVWSVGGATGGAQQVPFGSGLSRSPMSPTRFMFDRPMGYPQF